MGNTVAYLRISEDHNEGAGVERQLTECHEYADKNDLTIADVYTDNGVSAFTGKRRPEFERLLEDIGAGHVDKVVCWATDRLYRQPKDLERLVTAIGDTPVYAVKSGLVNLSTADGRITARMLGAVSAHSSEKQGERVAAANRQRAMNGHGYSGKRPFGWQRHADGTRGLEPHTTEGPIVAEMYDRFLAGESLSAIGRWLTADGWTGTSGGQLSAAAISVIMQQPRHGGLVKLSGELIDVENAEGRLVPESNWRRAAAKFAEPGRDTGGRPANSPITGIAHCYSCGMPMKGASHESGKAKVRRLTYTCKSHHVAWQRDDLDGLVRSEIVGYLIDYSGVLLEAIREAATARQSETGLGDLERLRSDRDGIGVLLADGVLSLEAFTSAAAALDAKIEVLTARAVPAAPRALKQLLAAGDIGDAYDGLPLNAKRQILAELLDDIIVHPKKTGRVDFNWKTS